LPVQPFQRQAAPASLAKDTQHRFGALHTSWGIGVRIACPRWVGHRRGARVDAVLSSYGESPYWVVREEGAGKGPHGTSSAPYLSTRKAESHDPADGQAVIRHICAPVITGTGARVAGLRPGDPRAHALLAALPSMTSPGKLASPPDPGRVLTHYSDLQNSGLDSASKIEVKLPSPGGSVADPVLHARGGSADSGAGQSSPRPSRQAAQAPWSHLGRAE